MCLSEEKSFCISISISLLIFLGKIKKYQFSKGKGQFCTFIVQQGRGLKPNRMVADGEGKWGQKFLLFCVRPNEWPLIY